MIPASTENAPPPGKMGPPLVGETLEFLRDGFGFVERRVAEHGPVFQTNLLGRKTAVISGPDACTVWTDKDLISRAGAQPSAIFTIFAGPSLPHLDAEQHAARKQLVLEAFSPDALAHYLPGLERVVKASLDRWSGMGEFSGIAEFKRMSIEGICNSFLEINPGPQTESIVKAYDTVTKGIGGLPLAVPGTALYDAIKARDGLLVYFEEQIRRHQAWLMLGKDGLSRILAARLPDGTCITPDAVKRELHHIMIAGYIIFAEFASMVIELDRQPDLRQTLEAEIKRKFMGPRSKGKAIDLKTLNNCPLLTRFVMETKRLTPILPAVFGKAKKTFEFKGFTIPEGWMVLWALRSTNMDPAIYTDATKFDPDRFAPDREEHLRHEHAFVPHGPGPMSTHQCPGTDYATIFMKVFAVSLLRRGLEGGAWRLPQQDLEYNWGLTPPEPKDGLKVSLYQFTT